MIPLMAELTQRKKAGNSLRIAGRRSVKGIQKRVRPNVGCPLEQKKNWRCAACSPPV